MRKPSEPATAWAHSMFERMGASGKIWMLRWSRSTPQTRITSICRDRARRITPRRSRVSPIDDDLAVEGFLRSRLDKCGAGTLFSGRPPSKSPDTPPDFSSPDQAARRLDDLPKTPGDLEIA